MKNIAKTLEDIVRVELHNTPLPYKKGNSIRIGSVAIRHSKKHGYIVFDCLKQKQLTVTFSRTAALALAKFSNNDEQHKKIIDLDNRLSKFYNDGVFYQNIITQTQDEIKRCVAEDRLDIAKAQLETTQNTLEDIIFNTQ